MNTSQKLKTPFSQHKFYLASLGGQYRRVLNLKPAQHKVFHIILGNLASNNHCSLSVTDIAEEYSMQQATVSKAISGLIDLMLIYKIKRSIIVDPHYCWRGSIDAHYRAIHAHKKMFPHYQDMMVQWGFLDSPF